MGVGIAAVGGWDARAHTRLWRFDVDGVGAGKWSAVGLRCAHSARLVIWHAVMACIGMTHRVMAYRVMAQLVIWHVVMANIVMAFIFMAHRVMAHRLQPGW